MIRRFPALLLATALLLAQSPDPARAVINHISASALRGHVAFLASDSLEGRDTPSRGLDIAAEYIATQFRLIGLAPAGADGYFQKTMVSRREQDHTGLVFTFSSGGRQLSVGADETYLTPTHPLDFDHQPVLVLKQNEHVDPSKVQGKIVYLESARLFEQMEGQHPALILYSARRLPAKPRVVLAGGEDSITVPIVKTEVAAFLKAANNPRLTLHVKAAHERLSEVRNVAGLLRGSDPKLREQVVIVSSHYDHMGLASTGDDRVFNGANDDASGVASMIETAAALASLHPRPKRSVLFLAFFGEEKGLLGSQYYAAHPLEPLSKTIAQLNLEQMGRTDSSEGSNVRAANLTGWDYSSLTQIVVEAGQQAGIRIWKNAKASNPYFTRSDNASLARAGIPAQTMSVTYDFPDYHAVGDEWQKIDYANMARVDGAVALAVLRLASTLTPPHWNENYAPAQPFAKATKDLNQPNATH